MEWHSEILPKTTQKALDYLKGGTWLSDEGWYLAGGTALALQVGHRQSVDLDFFNPKKSFSPTEVIKHFPADIWRAEIVKEGTIYGKIMGAKVSFIAYPFFVPKLPFLQYGSIPVLNKEDIAVMKIIAISQRGRKRDFIDLFWFSQNISPLSEAIAKLPEQYPTVAHNYHHIIKSLTYFADAEEDPMPTVFFEADWKTIKKYFQKEIPSLAKKFLGLK